MAAQRSLFSCDPIEALCHFSVGLKERLGRNRNCQAADLIAQVRFARDEVGLAAHCRFANSVDASVEHALAPNSLSESLSVVEFACRGDKPNLKLTCASAFANNKVAQVALARAAVVGAEALLATPGKRCLASDINLLGAEHASCQRFDDIPAARRMESTGQLARVALAKRELKLVAVAPLLGGRNDCIDRHIFELPKTLDRLLDGLLLGSKLRLVTKNLPRGTWVVCHCINPVWASFEHLCNSSLCVAALDLAKPGQYSVARDCTLRKHNEPVEPADSSAAMSQRASLELNYRARPRAWWLINLGHQAAPQSSSSMAFWACRRFSA